MNDDNRLYHRDMKPRPDEPPGLDRKFWKALAIATPFCLFIWWLVWVFS